MKTSFTRFIICILAVVSTSSKAQLFTSKGTVELGGEFSFTSQSSTVTGGSYYSGGSSESYNVLMFSPYIGVMTGKGFELGFMPSIAHGGDVTLLDLFFAPAININTGGSAYPYVEGLIGYSTYGGGSSTSGLGIGISGGIKARIGSSALFLFNVKYLHQSFEEEEHYYAYYPSYMSGTHKVEVSINTLFAGIGFRIFIVKSAKTNSSPGK